MASRKEIISYIINYIKSGEITSFYETFFLFKYEENKFRSFPKYEKVLGYIKNSRRHEEFFERIVQTANEYVLFAEDDTQYVDICSFLPLNQYLEKSKHVLDKMLPIINVKEKLPKPNIHNINRAAKSNINDEALKAESIELARLIIQLADKAESYMKKYAFFGDCYKNYPSGYPIFKSDDVTKRLKWIRDIKKEINRILAKEYAFDFFGDGVTEFNEMMPPIFNGLYALCSIHKEEYSVSFSSKEYPSIPDIEKHIVFQLTEYYSPLNKYLDKEYFISFNDEELELMKKLLLKYNPSLEIGLPTDFDGNLGEGEAKLNTLIGLSSVKESVKKIKAYIKANKNNNNLNVHMCFLGNPGTGKTEVARIMAEILYENHVLPTKKVVEVDRSGLVGQYVGETAIKTNRVIHNAMGGVLFIDEAYSLAKKDTGFDYGHEAIDALVKAMEDYRGKFCVIFAGYKNPLLEMIGTNEGLESRIQFHIDFENYSRDELSLIIDLMLRNLKYTIEDDAKDKILDITDVKRKSRNFANAREVRNILDQVIMCANIRNAKKHNLILADVDKYIKDNKIPLPMGTSKKHILTGEEELDALIGLSDIKKTIKKIRAFAKKNKDANLNMHMCFYGNPGTGKTEVARIVSRLLYEAGVLSEAKLIETNPNGLISQYVGATGKKTEQIINDALGGVLFVDEAYGLLTKSNVNSYGAEAVNTLLKAMEDKRGQFCCVLAGYRKEMKELLESNPGFESRIQFELDFPDYSKDELREIAKKMVAHQNMSIEEDALELLLDVVEQERGKKTFANARTLRNILDKVVLNQNLRTENIKSNLIVIDDVQEYITEEGIEIVSTKDEVRLLKIDLNKLKEEYSLVVGDDIDNTYLDQAVISIVDESGSQGTGFIISSSGLCLTCNHCLVGDGENQKARILFIAGKNKIKVYSKFDVLATDKDNDVALIQLLDDDNEYYYLPLADKLYKYEPLTEFITAGYPFGGESYSSISITDGKIASVNMMDDRKVVFANMFGKPGSSGSPIVDKETKRVIGIYWGGIKRADEMINCFTPVEFVWKLLGDK